MDRTSPRHWDLSGIHLLINSYLIFLNFHRINDPNNTKRVALSTIAKFYDPLGLRTPIFTKSKIFLQSLWSANVNWDDALPEPILSSWAKLTSQLSIVQNLKCPRLVLQPRASVELHGFCNASMSAYGVCLCLRSETNGESKAHRLCAK